MKKLRVWLTGWRRSYWVADDDGYCAGNLTRAFALDYAQGRSRKMPSGEPRAVVVMRQRGDVKEIVANFYGGKSA